MGAAGVGRWRGCGGGGWSRRRRGGWLGLLIARLLLVAWLLLVARLLPIRLLTILWRRLFFLLATGECESG